MSQGVDPQTVANFFNSRKFSRSLVLNLSVVCLMPANKPSHSSSNQTHIHVTGPSRYFFFDPSVADSKTSSSADIKFSTDISLANIKALSNNTSSIAVNDLEIENSFTCVKIAHRQSQDNQVQISKIRLDDPLFIKLRSNLYQNDLLIFLGDSNSQNLFAVGIPHSYYKANYAISNTTFYNLDNKVETTVKSALRKLEANYEKSDIISDIDLIDDSIYQQQLMDSTPSETIYEPVPKPDKITSSTEVVRRSASIGKEAVKDAGYLCRLDNSHTTFITKAEVPYIEAHHLIPISKQDDFENSLDVKANIVPLCPNCHAKIHYGKKEEVLELLNQLYDLQKDKLKLSGIDITFDDLVNYYF